MFKLKNILFKFIKKRAFFNTKRFYKRKTYNFKNKVKLFFKIFRIVNFWFVVFNVDIVYIYINNVLNYSNNFNAITTIIKYIDNRIKIFFITRNYFTLQIQIFYIIVIIV